jgi:CheY-like chemotaxis protein
VLCLTIGISEENSKKLFERFVQLEDARTKKFIGSGLGLFITKQLVNLMGGNIYLESKENIGSNFYFTIPYKRREAEMINSEISSSPATKLKREFYILVAEDNLINQKLIKKILEKENIQFSLATNGLKVLELLDQSTDSANKKFDLILMDIQMPEMDGITATKLIRNRNDLYKNIPIIATTANGMDSQIEEYLKNGITSCITKPIIFKQLIDEIDRLIP